MVNRLDPLHYYRWHWKRWRLSRRVQRLHWAAEGFFRTLLDEQFAEGYIPDDVEELALICRCPVDVMSEHWPALEQFFPLLEVGKRVNANQEENRTEMDRMRVQQSIAGKASAAARAAANLNGRSTSVERNSTAADHIVTGVQPEEKRTVKKSKEQRNTLASTAPAVTARQKVSDQRDEKLGDPRHIPFKFACEVYAKHMGVTFIWDGSEAKRLSGLLAGAPELTLPTFQRCLNNRARSPAVLHGDRPRMWLATILSFESGPINQFKQPEGTKNGAFKGKTEYNIDAARDAIATLRSRESGRDRETADEVGSAPTSEGRSRRLLDLHGGSNAVRSTGHEASFPEFPAAP